MKARYLIVAVSAVLAFAPKPGVAQTINLTIENGTAQIGGMGTIAVSISGASTAIGNAQLDVLVPTDTFNPSVGGTPPSVVGCSSPYTAANGFAPTSSLPSGTSPAGTKRMRLSVVDLNGLGRITNGPLYTCSLPVVATAAGMVTVNGDKNNVGDTTGANILPSTIVPGTIDVETGPTSTPTSTLTPVPPTATVTPTGGAPTATRTGGGGTATPTKGTPTRTAPPTNTGGGGGGGFGDDDSCQVVAPSQSHAGWLLLIPAAILIWRRRSR